MIDTPDKLRHFLIAEKNIYFPEGGKRLPFGLREKDILYGYIYYLRHAEYYHNTGKKIREYFYQVLLRRMEMKYAIHIGINTCDEGLSIAHVGPVIIHGKCKIGKNLRINVGVNIGANGGEPPKLGDNIYIGPGAKIFGDITIANGCKVGANAVVNKSCLEEDCVLVGVPAHAIVKGRPN